MKVHTTNHADLFIAVADDCPATAGEIPPVKGEKRTVANLQYDLLTGHPPYTFTSDDVLFQVYADRQDLTESERPAARKAFFSKGQPCFRASPLTKRYGWGVHNDKNGKLKLVGRETSAYEQFLHDPEVEVVKAMKGSR